MLRKISIAVLTIALSSTSFVLTGCAHHHDDRPYGLRGDHDSRTYPEQVNETRDFEKNQEWQKMD